MSARDTDKRQLYTPEPERGFSELKRMIRLERACLKQPTIEQLMSISANGPAPGHSSELSALLERALSAWCYDCPGSATTTKRRAALAGALEVLAADEACPSALPEKRVWGMALTETEGAKSRAAARQKAAAANLAKRGAALPDALPGAVTRAHSHIPAVAEAVAAAVESADAPASDGDDEARSAAVAVAVAAAVDAMPAPTPAPRAAAAVGDEAAASAPRNPPPDSDPSLGGAELRWGYFESIGEMTVESANWIAHKFTFPAPEWCAGKVRRQTKSKPLLKGLGASAAWVVRHDTPHDRMKAEEASKLKPGTVKPAVIEVAHELKREGYGVNWLFLRPPPMPDAPAAPHCA